MKVLLVEDEALLALDIAESLRNQGFAVMGPHASAEAALRDATKDRPDFAVIDWKLTGPMDGLELAGRLAECQIDSIIASAHRHVAEAARRVGLGFLSKPYDPGDLLEQIAIRRSRNAALADEDRSPDRRDSFKI